LKITIKYEEKITEKQERLEKLYRFKRRKVKIAHIAPYYVTITFVLNKLLFSQFICVLLLQKCIQAIFYALSKFTYYESRIRSIAKDSSSI